MRRRLQTLILIAVTLGASACDTRGSSGASVTPHGRVGDSELQPEGEFEGESINELAARLERLVARRDLQVSAANSEAGKCKELCELSHTICEVKTKMCEIADEHVSNDEYQDLCRRAKQRCREASDSCVRCVEHHQSGGPLTPEPGTCSGVAGEPDPAPAANPPNK